MFKSPLLAIRPFRNLWLGQAVSQFGDSFYFVVFMFMVKKLTGSIAMVGYVGALETIPFLVLSPYAGVLADRIDRKKIMLGSDILSGAFLILFSLCLLQNAHPANWLFLLVPGALSCVRCFFMPAKSASIPSLVPADMMLKANALSATTANFMPLIGLAMTGSLMAIMYALAPNGFFFAAVVVNAFSFFVSAYFIALLPAIMPDRKDAHETHPLTDFKDGIRYVKSRHDLVVLIILLTVFRLMVSPFFVVFIAANESWFGGKPQTLAWLEFSFFAGMIVGSYAVGKTKPKRPMLWFCYGLLTVGAGVAAMAFSPVPAVFIVWNTICGLAVPAADIPINTYLQISVPDAFRGRVGSAINMIATGVMPIGLTMSGVLVAEFGLVAAFLVMGLGMMGACLIGFADPKFRNVEMPLPAEAV